MKKSVWKGRVHIPVPLLWVLRNRRQNAERNVLHCSYGMGRRCCVTASWLMYSFSKAWCALSSLASLAARSFHLVMYKKAVTLS